MVYVVAAHKVTAKVEIESTALDGDDAKGFTVLQQEH